MEINPENTDLEKVKELALKLKEMADRGGTKNEREVASNKLQSLLKKYGLNIKDVVSNKIKLRTFPFRHEDECLIVSHVIWSVVPNIQIQRKGKQKKAMCKLNPEQYIEIREKMKFYLEHFNEERNSFVIAYIFRNNLEVKSDSKSGTLPNHNPKSVGNIILGVNEGNFQSKRSKKQLKQA